MRALGLVVLIACGGAQRPPAFDARGLAAELDGHLAALAQVIHTHRDDCPSMERELRALFARMEPTLARARQAQEDATQAKQLTTELRAYDGRAREREAAIERDFSIEATCARHDGVREAMRTMPTL